MPNVAESFLTGLHSGRAEVHQAREAAEREIRQKILKASLDREKLQDLMQEYQFKFKAKSAQAAATSGRPEASYPRSDIEGGMLSSRGLGLAESPSVQPPLELTPIQSPALPEMGIESYPIPRQTAEQQSFARVAQKIQDLMYSGQKVGVGETFGSGATGPIMQGGPTPTPAPRAAPPLGQQLLEALRTGNKEEATRIRQVMKDEADLARAPKDPKDASLSEYGRERAARTIQSVNEILPKINKWTTGYGNLFFGKLPESEAIELESELNTLKAAIAFNELTAMREASKTGGSLGNVSNVELTLLESALGALNPRQGAANMRAQLAKIKGSIERFVAEKDKATKGGTVPPPPTTSGPAVGTTRTFNGETRKWTGSEWALVP